MTKAVHQLVHTLSYGDAISTEVLSLERVLKESGVDSKIFAINEHPLLRGRSRPYKELLNELEADIIIHYSIGSPLNEIYANWNRGKRALIYHNITPASWFEKVNARVAKDIRHGLEELPGLCAISDLRISDSRFNQKELSEIGYSSSVLELTVDPGRFSPARNEGIYQLVKNTPGTHVLHVGRLAPNKCIEDILKTFYFLRHKVDKNSRLWLVGIDTDTEVYSFSLKRLAAELLIDDRVTFAGCMADQEIKALYEACSVYLCMSEHEGYCLPLVEAMNFGLPVIAYDAGAVRDTIGSGGIICTEKRHSELAELCAEVSTNQDLRAKLQEAGKKRVAELSFDQFSKAVNNTILNALSSSASRVAP